MLKQYESAFSALGMCALFCVLAAFLAGCGPSPRHYKNLDDPTESLVSFGASISDEEWNCPAGDNVLPNDGFSYALNGHFTVCVNRMDSSRFLISGNANTSTLCAYPMKASGNSVTVVESPKCFNISAGDVALDFNANQINYMVIVGMNYTNQMNQCLSSSAACPAYSKGFVQ